MGHAHPAHPRIGAMTRACTPLMPAKAGIQHLKLQAKNWMPAFAGMSGENEESPLNATYLTLPFRGSHV
jgi:hypothetical protein